MSGFWEALFRDERQDWSSCIVSYVGNLAAAVAALPGVIAGFTVAAVLFVLESVSCLVISHFTKHYSCG